MSTGGGAPPGSPTDQQLTPVLRTSWRTKWWTEEYRSQKRVSARRLGGVINWTLMRLCFCLSLTQPVRLFRGQWGRSRSGWQPWCCSTAEPRKRSPTLRRKRQTVPRRSPRPQSHLTARRLLGDGEFNGSVLFYFVMFGFEATRTSLRGPDISFKTTCSPWLLLNCLSPLPQARGSGHSPHFVFQDDRTPETAGWPARHSQGTTPYTTHTVWEKKANRAASRVFNFWRLIHKGMI